jgi:hypothetical protein
MRQGLASECGILRHVRHMDRATMQMTPAQMPERERAKSIYVGRSGLRGGASEFAYDQAEARAKMHLPDANMAVARAHFRLAYQLLKSEAKRRRIILQRPAGGKPSLTRPASCGKRKRSSPSMSPACS